MDSDTFSQFQFKIVNSLEDIIDETFQKLDNFPQKNFSEVLGYLHFDRKYVKSTFRNSFYLSSEYIRKELYKKIYFYNRVYNKQNEIIKDTFKEDSKKINEISQKYRELFIELDSFNYNHFMRLTGMFIEFRNNIIYSIDN